MDCYDTGYEYSDLEYLVDLFKKTINGNRFLVAASAIYPEKDRKELELIWFTLKAAHNNQQ